MTVTGVVALTGATGFIGSHLLSHLLAQGLQVKILVRRPQLHTWLPREVEIITGNMHDAQAVTALVSGADYVIHCAGRVKASHPHHFHQDNVLASELLFKIAQRSSSLKKFIFISSLSARQAKISHYAASKFAAEQCLIDSGIEPWTIIRPPAVYGPRDTELKPVFDWMQRGSLWVPADAKQRFSLLHVDDLCHVVSHSLEAEDSEQNIIEPDDGTADGYDWRDVQAIASNFFQRKIILIRAPASLLLGLASINLFASKLLNRSAMLTPSKVQELLHDNWVVNSDHIWSDWKPMIDLKKGLYTLYS